MLPVHHPPVVAEPLAVAAALLERHPAAPAHRLRPLLRPHFPNETDKAVVVGCRQALAYIRHVPQRPAGQQLEEALPQPVAQRRLRDREEAGLERGEDARVTHRPTPPSLAVWERPSTAPTAVSL